MRFENRNRLSGSQESGHERRWVRFCRCCCRRLPIILIVNSDPVVFALFVTLVNQRGQVPNRLVMWIYAYHTLMDIDRVQFFALQPNYSKS